MKNTIKARKIVAVDPDTLWSRISGKRIPVAFDDGVIEMGSQELIISAYFWVFVSLHGRKTRLTKDMVVSTHYNDGLFQKGTARGLFNRVLNYMLEDLGIKNSSEALYHNLEIVVRSNDKLYNALADNCDKYVLSLDILDYIEAARHPELMAMKEVMAADPRKEVVEEGRAKASALLAKGLYSRGKELRVSKAARSGLIKRSQLMQSVFARGYVHDLNKELLPHPVLDNLVEGMRTPENYALLARDSSVSAAASKKDLREVVHKSSKHGYIATNMRRIENVDCKSPYYLSMRVRASDLPRIQGRYHILDDGTLGRITLESTELVGEHIRLRSPVYCTLPNKQHVCATCYGDTHSHISLHDAIGKAVAREGSRDDIQQPLSMKHEVGDMDTGGVCKGGIFKKIFKVQRDGGEIISLKSHPNAVKIILSFNHKDVAGISMINTVENVSTLPIKRISNIHNVGILIQRKKSYIDENIVLSEGKVGAVMTYSLLEYIKNHPKADVKHDHEFMTVDITAYVKADRPLLKFPDLVATSTDHNNKLVSLYDFSNGKDKNPYGFPNTIIEIYDLVNEQRFANLVSIELIMAAYLVREKRNGAIDYDMCRGWEKGARQIQYNDLISNRSLAASMLYSQQNTSLWNPARYALNNTSPPLTLDVAMLPKQTVGNPLYEDL